jgi:surface polysaccharide O-acyltransferase-like enzyme
MKYLSATVIRTIAIVSVIAIHATNEDVAAQMTQLDFFRWSVVNVYQAIFRVTGLPLFVMLTGFLLLQPEKYTESLRIFFKKRWNRLAASVFFFGIVYFIWDFTVKNQPFTSNFVIQNMLSVGPYYHFWYLYMIVGVYLLTPFIRLLMPNLTKKYIGYFAALWFTGTTIVSVMPMFGFTVNTDIFPILGFVGYFVLGAFLPQVKINTKYLLALIVVGIAAISIGTYYMAWFGNSKLYFFQEYLNPIVILTSMMVFIVLFRTTPGKLQSYPKINRVVDTISDFTLPIFLLHPIIMESLQKGYFGFTLSGNLLNEIIEVPILTIATLAICLAIIIPVSKIPIIKKLVGVN